MDGEFKMKVELGNAAMRSKHHVADALIEAAEKLRGGAKEGRIRDVNGNTVGEWTMIRVEEDDDDGI